MSNPGISVIVPCYNLGAYIEDTMSSIKAHHAASPVPMEVIIVDDKSPQKETQDALDRIEAAKDSFPFPVRVVRMEENSGGPSKPRNTGIALAQYDYICPVDADDMLNNDPAVLGKGSYFSRALETLQENPDVAIFGSHMRKFDATGVLPPDPPWGPTPYSEKSMLLHGALPSFAVFRKEDAEVSGGYNEGLKTREDWVCFLGILNGRAERGLATTVVKAEEEYLMYRQLEGSVKTRAVDPRAIYGAALDAAPLLFEKNFPGMDRDDPVGDAIKLSKLPKAEAAALDPEPAVVKWLAAWNRWGSAQGFEDIDPRLQKMAADLDTPATSRFLAEKPRSLTAPDNDKAAEAGNAAEKKAPAARPFRP